ncbi:hypothetical protein HK101_002959, partial [Irineochytrium annulatum]
MTYWLVNCQANVATCKPASADCSQIVLVADGAVGVAPLFVSASGWSMGLQSPLRLAPGTLVDDGAVRPMIMRQTQPFFANWEGQTWNFEGLFSFNGEGVTVNVTAGDHATNSVAGLAKVQCNGPSDCSRQGAVANVYADDGSPIYADVANNADNSAT